MTQSTPQPARCATCQRSPEAINCATRECAVIDCPHRRVCWSDRPPPEDGRTPSRIPRDGDRED